MVIYLDLLLPASSSDPPENRSGRSIVFISVLLRMRFTYALPVTSQAVSSYLTISPLPLMWRYISVALACPYRTLSGILPCEARTFLTVSLSSETARPFVRLSANYYITSYTSKQLPPINSLKRDVFGIASLGIFKKYSKNFNSLFAS